MKKRNILALLLLSSVLGMSSVMPAFAAESAAVYEEEAIEDGEVAEEEETTEEEAAVSESDLTSLEEYYDTDTTGGSWKYLSGKWYYTVDGTNLTGWQKLSWNGKSGWYYFSENGVMRSGWQKLSWNGKSGWFYFSGSGVMRTGWQKLKWSGGTDWFYFDGNGALRTGWQKLSWSGGSSWFYFDAASGAMYTGEHTIDGKSYTFTDSGVLEEKVTWEDGWISGGIDTYYRDDANNSDNVLHEASVMSYLTDSPTGSGKGANKILLHSTEGNVSSDQMTSAFGIYGKVTRGSKKGITPAHFTVDIRNRRIYQHFSLNQPSEAIAGNSDKNDITSNDRMAGIQIEIMGSTASYYDSDFYLPSSNNFSDDDWDYLAKLLLAISEETGIPLTSSVDWDSPVRMSEEDFMNYTGILGHMHTPETNTHTDPQDIWEKVEAAIERVSSANK